MLETHVLLPPLNNSCNNNNNSNNRNEFSNETIVSWKKTRENTYFANIHIIQRETVMVDFYVAKNSYSTLLSYGEQWKLMTTRLYYAKEKSQNVAITTRMNKC